MRLEFGNHCVYQIRYQVMVMKYRKLLLRPQECQETLRKTFLKIAERYEYIMEEIGTDGNHVHVFVVASGYWSPSRIMQVLKSISAKEMLRALPDIRRRLWGGAFWSEGGYIGTVEEGTTAQVVQEYIRKQSSEHEKALGRQLKFLM